MTISKFKKVRQTFLLVSILASLCLGIGATAVRHHYLVYLLTSASKNGDLPAINRLINMGVDVNTSDPEIRYTPLMSAAEMGRFDVAHVLIEHGANVNAKATYNGSTALSEALRGGHVEIVRLLLQHKANPNQDGPLFIAAQQSCRDNLAMVQLLVQSGADINARAEDGRTPLSVAQKAGNTHIVNFLRSKGAR